MTAGRFHGLRRPRAGFAPDTCRDGGGTGQRCPGHAVIQPSLTTVSAGLEPARYRHRSPPPSRPKTPRRATPQTPATTRRGPWVAYMRCSLRGSRHDSQPPRVGRLPKVGRNLITLSDWSIAGVPPRLTAAALPPAAMGNDHGSSLTLAVPPGCHRGSPAGTLGLGQDRKLPVDVLGFTTLNQHPGTAPVR
jgi:hypothetical protein